jgi:hypothetical protein
LLQQTGGSLGAFFICAVIWAASGATGFFWPIFVALAVLVPLQRNGWRLYGPAPELDRVERELENRRQRDEQKHRLRREVRADARAERRAERYDRRRGG